MGNEISDYQSKMLTLLTRYKTVKLDDFNKVFDCLDKLNQNQLTILRDKLDKFYQTEYKELHRIFRMPIDNSPNGPELWDRYFKQGKTNLIEMRMFLSQSRICKAKWKEIIKLINTGNKKEKKANVEEANNQQNVNPTSTEAIGS